MEISLNKPKRSILDIAVNVFCFAVMLYFCSGEVSHLYQTLDTTESTSEHYDRHFSVSSTFPYLGSYLLMPPKGYDSKNSYPLVVVLHDMNRHADAATALMQPDFRNMYPFFVMVPIAPKRSFWATPKDRKFQMQSNSSYPDNLPQVMIDIDNIKKKYSIDNNKIIIAGYSMGAAGVIGALERYPDVFGAGIASSGVWSPQEISHITAPLFLVHGDQDKIVPTKNSILLRDTANNQNIAVNLDIQKGKGHDIGLSVFLDTKIWDKVLTVLK